MTRALKVLSAVAALGLAAFPPVGFAQATNLKNPDWMVAKLDEAVALTPEQRAKAGEIIRASIAATLALPGPGAVEKATQIRQDMRRQIRALLTPAQQKKYDRTPQSDGGGLTQMPPETKVARLNEAVGLTSAQAKVAQKIFAEELDALLEIPEADRPLKGMEARQTARAEVRAILTPEQLSKYDTTPQSRGGGAPR